MKNFTVENAITACGGEFFGDKNILQCALSSITSDSRKAAEGSLFAAICGERVDGHDFAAAAEGQGAICTLCERKPTDYSGNYILAASTQTALGKIARAYRDGFDIPIIGVVGSVGKTTAKEMLASTLSQRFNVHKTSGNLNNELGVPFTLFELQQSHTAAVIEMGISDFGEMRRLSEIARPSHVVFTNIGDAHLEFLGSREGVLRAKGEVLEHLDPDGIVFINGDDELLRSLETRNKKISFGLSPSCDVCAKYVEYEKGGEVSCVIEYAGRSVPINIRAYGEHMIYAALAAAAVAFELGLSDEEIAKGISAYEGIGGRSRIIKCGGLTIVDDCYNANPSSVQSALGSLTRLSGRKVCILGDMRELGEDAAHYHREIGKTAAAYGVSLVLTCGELSAETAKGAGVIAKHFESKSELIENLPRLILQGDTVLVKASRFSKFEEIVEQLQKLFG